MTVCLAAVGVVVALCALSGISCFVGGPSRGGRALYRQSRSAEGKEANEPAPSTPPSYSVQMGDTLEGTVQKFVPQGALIDLGLSKPGFLHRNQIEGKGKVANAEDVLKVGKKVKVRAILEVYNEIQVTMCAWDRKGASDFEVGALVAGEVVRVNPNSVYVDIGAVSDAVLYRNALMDPADREKDLTEIFEVGQYVQAKVKGKTSGVKLAQ